MNTYFFILGHSPAVSAAEIKAVLRNNGKDYKDICQSPEALLLKTDMDEKTIIRASDRLGGTIKTGVILDSLEFQNSSETADLIAGKITANVLAGRYLNVTEKRIAFGFSAYRLNNNGALILKELRNLGLEIKKVFKKEGMSARFVTSKNAALSSVIVGQNKLLEKGADICFFFGNNKIYIGKTLFVQNYRRFGMEDYGRPSRDAKSGMLPPKLARIMINLSGANPNNALLDPFCGSGTILTEAALLGFTRLIGADISSVAVADTERNLKWTNDNFKTNTVYKLILSDIRNLPQQLKEKISSIITEPYLGPYIHDHDNAQKIDNIIQELSVLYLDAFRTFKDLLMPGGKVTIVFPIIKKSEKFFYLPILDKLVKLGFIPELDRILSNQRGGIIYSRPDQNVLREIFRFNLK